MSDAEQCRSDSSHISVLKNQKEAIHFQAMYPFAGSAAGYSSLFLESSPEHLTAVSMAGSKLEPESKAETSTCT